jgi:hypothetical protein
MSLSPQWPQVPGSAAIAREHIWQQGPWTFLSPFPEGQTSRTAPAREGAPTITTPLTRPPSDPIDWAGAAARRAPGKGVQLGIKSPAPRPLLTCRQPPAPLHAAWVPDTRNPLPLPASACRCDSRTQRAQRWRLRARPQRSTLWPRLPRARAPSTGASPSGVRGGERGGASPGAGQSVRLDPERPPRRG